MAITFVNAGTITSDNAGNFTLNAPASPQNNDIWVCLFKTNSADGVVDSSNISDWNFLTSGGTSTNVRIAVAWFRYVGSNPDLTATWGGANRTIAGIVAFRGCITSGSPVDTTGSITSTNNSASASIAGITPSENDTMLVAMDAASNNSGRTPLPSGFSAAFDPGTDNAYNDGGGSAALYYKTHVSGATGSFTATADTGTPNWETVLIALKQPVVGGQPAVLRGRYVPGMKRW